MPEHSPPLTDLSKPATPQADSAYGMADMAVFAPLGGKLPPGCGVLVAAGPEQAVQSLQSLHFSSDDRTRLRLFGAFSCEFVDWLREVRFTGDIDPMPEALRALELGHVSVTLSERTRCPAAEPDRTPGHEC